MAGEWLALSQRPGNSSANIDDGIIGQETLVRSRGTKDCRAICDLAPVTELIDQFFGEYYQIGDSVT